MMKELTDSSFYETVKGAETPVLVDFWATWCGPCRALAPELEKVAGNLEGVVEFVKVDIDNAPNIARLFDVMSVPTLMLFKDGEPVARWVGARPASAIEAEIRAAL